MLLKGAVIIQLNITLTLVLSLFVFIYFSFYNTASLRRSTLKRLHETLYFRHDPREARRIVHAWSNQEENNILQSHKRTTRAAFIHHCPYWPILCVSKAYICLTREHLTEIKIFTFSAAFLDIPKFISICKNSWFGPSYFDFLLERGWACSVISDEPLTIWERSFFVSAGVSAMLNVRAWN